MRKSLILAMILLVSIISPFGQIGSTTAQVNPDVSISCDSENVSTFDQFVWWRPIENVTLNCTLSNPTLYYQVVSIQVRGAAGDNANDTVSVEPADTETFSFEIEPPYSPDLEPVEIDIDARVEEANGAPCPTCTTQTNTTILTPVWGGEYIQVEYNHSNHHGDFVLELLPNDAPIHVQNFLDHASVGNYNGSIFHRVIDDFVIQGGDFENGDGTGGYSYDWHGYCRGIPSLIPGPMGQMMCERSNWTMPDESDNGLTHVQYALGMAKTANPDTAGSQFYIVDNNSSPHHLDGIHTVFGHVIHGFEEIDYISGVMTTAQDRPVDNVTITGMEIVDWPIQLWPEEQEADTDGDGVPDSEDAFPNDENETADSDGDGTGDNADAFPNDANETHDDDGDGTGNNSDAFPQDGNETHDDDGDGVGNNSDAFPQDANETMDSDGDGVGDNADADPDDPNIRFPADIEINVTDNSIYVLAFAILILAAVMVFVRRRPPSTTTTPFVTEGDSIWNDV